MSAPHDPSSVASPRSLWLAWPAALLALVVLNASLTFKNVWPTPKIDWAWALSLELGVVVLALTLARRWTSRLTRTVLPMLWVVLVIGRYLAVTGTRSVRT